MEHSFSGQALTVTYGSIWRRLAAAIVDQIALSIANGVLGMILGFALSMILINAGLPKTSLLGIVRFVSGIVGLISSWAYFAVMESSESRATFGKMLLRLQVSSVHGEQISLLRASGRYWAKVLFNFLCAVVSLVITGIFCFALVPGFNFKEMAGGGAAAVIAMVFAALGILIVVSLIVQVAGVLVFFMTTARKQMMHDVMAGTVVTKKSDGLGQIPS